jgi:hypothetical protein
MNSSPKAKPSIVLNGVGAIGGSVSVLTPSGSRMVADAGVHCGHHPLAKGPAEMGTCEPTIPSRGFARTESDSRHAPETASPMPSIFMANMSVHSTIRCDSHTTRRVNTHIVFPHSARRSRSFRCGDYAVAAFSFSMAPPGSTMPNGGFG